MKFIGHLDVMRYFQKVMRRSDVDIAYSEGFSPHQIMSFAAPLGVGLTSIGEYFDIEVHSTESSQIMIQRINQQMVEGMKILDYRLLCDEAANAMSSVAAADYKIEFRDPLFSEKLLKMSFTTESSLSSIIQNFLHQNTIEVIKTTKKSEKTVDIKPMILEMSSSDDKTIFMKVMTGSANNLKPELVMKAFCNFIGKELGEFDLLIERLETYGLMNDKYIPLSEYGEEIKS